MCAHPPSPPEQSPSPPASESDAAQVSIQAQLPTGTRLNVALELTDDTGHTLQRRAYAAGEGASQAELQLQSPHPTAHKNHLLRQLSSHGGWFWLAVALYLLIRLVALADYPIYFFTDEAVQTILAADFLRDGLRNYDQEFLPTFFKNVYQYNLGVSVYLQALPLALFGKSVAVTRGVNVLVSLLAAICSGLALRRSFGNPRPWLAVLVLSATPAWFLHSRTAFETSLAVSFYAGFLYCYLLYRGGQPRAIYASLVFAALSFYSYSPAQMVVVVTALLLLASDFTYHWQQRRTLRQALLLGLLLALPYVRFQLAHPLEQINHLKLIGSYWLQPVSIWQKLGQFFSIYLQGLNPLYWYAAPTSIDLERHIMNGYGHLLRYLLPFGLIGFGLALKNWRHWAYRACLAAVLAAPSGAALVGMGITRALFMVIPAALLTALGISAVMDWITRRLRFERAAVALAFGLLLGGFNLYLLGDALLRGPTWSTNYTLTGMQYGARQVFNAALDFTARHPYSRVVLSPTWANGTDILARFFLPETAPVELRGIEGYLSELQPLDDQTVFILPPDELERARQSNKFTAITPLFTLPYPDGQPGFFFVQMRYVADIAAIFQAELEDRRSMIPGEAIINGETAHVAHSRLDMGEIKHIFDGDPDTMIRTLAANPLQLQLDFSAPRLVKALVLRVGSTATTFEVTLRIEGQEKPLVLRQQLEEGTVLRNIEIPVTGERLISQIYIRIKNTNDPEPGHVHLWELSIQ